MRRLFERQRSLVDRDDWGVRDWKLDATPALDDSPFERAQRFACDDGASGGDRKSGYRTRFGRYQGNRKVNDIAASGEWLCIEPRFREERTDVVQSAKQWIET